MNKFLILIFFCSTIISCDYLGSNKEKNDFESFLTKFNKNSAFQEKRIDFPLKHVDIVAFQREVSTITKDEWKYKDLSYDSSAYYRKGNRYGQEKKVWDDSAKVIFKGIGNGMYMEYLFQREDDKWKLTKWSNLSN